jgi:acyl phosphate:glycerol-3-phosphate acyltransferase
LRGLTALVVAYLVGAVPVGYVVARVFGLDIRHHGSGNIGTTNVLRTLGRIPAGLTLLGDVAKGYTAVAAGRAMLGGEPAALVAACGALAVVGNCWPVYLRFRGGKGVATALGAFLGLMPLVTVPAALVWVVIVAASRYVSLASIAAALSVPIAALVLRRYPGAFVAAAAVVALVIVTRHRDNIVRLCSGTERRLGPRASA